MNIFYIGPYRQDDFNGIVSRNIIKSIANKHKIFIRPIYYSANDIVADLEPDILSYEDNDINNYDYLIQHVKPNDCLHTQQFDKNVLIPISDSIAADYVHYFIDHTIDNILFEKRNHIPNVCYNNNKYQTFDYDIYFDKNNKAFDIGPLSAMKKFYFIGEYKSNIDIIYSLMRSFIYLRKTIDQEYALVLFVINISQNEVNHLQNLVHETYKKLNATHTISKILIIPISMSYNNIIAAHNSADIFLNFDIKNSSQINKKIALKLNKPTVDLAEIGGCEKSLNINGNILDELEEQISDQNIIDSMLNFIIDNHVNKSTTSSSNSKHISDFL